MEKIIRYLMEGDGNTPKFVKDGGYFPLNEELVGKSVDENTRHVPSTVVRMNRSELLDRIKLAHKDGEGQYLLNREGLQYTDEDMESMTQAFLDMVALPDYE